MDLVLRAARVITPDGERRADVGVEDGRIVAVADHLDAATVVELREDEVLLPGLVDTHVHVNDPGRSDWEGFDSATRAAAAGGVTTIVDMPLNSLPPTTTAAALEVKRDSARDRVHVDVGFWGGIVPTNLDDLADLHDAGVFGFKCFLVHSGVDEFPHVDEDLLRAALATLQPRGALTIVHAEDPHEVTGSGPGYRSFLDSRPHRAEARAITTVVDLANETKARLHLLHLSSEQGLHHVRTAKGLGLAVTAETCPHYLTFVAEEIGDAATEFKCCPPIRDAANRESLWRALKGDLIDLVVTDHSPCTPDLKQGDFATAWGGIASLQLGLPAVWTGARQRGHTLSDVVRWMATRPADLVGLGAKGRIAPGADADFCVFAPDEAFVVDRARLHHRNPVTPYHGRPLAGVVRQAWLRGQPIGDRPRGRLLSRTDTSTSTGGDA